MSNSVNHSKRDVRVSPARVWVVCVLCTLLLSQRNHWIQPHSAQCRWQRGKQASKHQTEQRKDHGRCVTWLHLKQQASNVTPQSKSARQARNNAERNDSSNLRDHQPSHLERTSTQSHANADLLRA